MIWRMLFLSSLPYTITQLKIHICPAILIDVSRHSGVCSPEAGKKSSSNSATAEAENSSCPEGKCSLARVHKLDLSFIHGELMPPSNSGLIERKQIARRAIYPSQLF